MEHALRHQDKFSPSYSLHGPEYFIGAVVLCSLPLKQTLH